jgi:hypothetical protein
MSSSEIRSVGTYAWIRLYASRRTSWQKKRDTPALLLLVLLLLLLMSAMFVT